MAEEVSAFVETNVVIPGIRVRGGKHFEFSNDGLQITTRRLMGQPTVEMIAWDQFKQCSVETTCCSGYLVLTKQDGSTFALKVSKRALKTSAKAIYSKMNMGVKLQVDPKVNEMIGKRKHVTVEGSGLILDRVGCCRESTTFIPWESVVSIELAVGCCWSTLTVNTVVEIAVPEVIHEDAQGAEGDELTAEEGEAAPQNQTSNPADTGHVTVSISGSAVAMERVFEEFMLLLNDGKMGQPLPDAPTVRNTELLSTGIIMKYGCWSKMYLPWQSVASAEMEAPCLGKPDLVLTDGIGTKLYVKDAGQKGFDVVRAQIATARGGSVDARPGMKPIVRNHVKLVPDGVCIAEWISCCKKSTRFIPWLQVDGLQMDITCCGGTLTLITEDGERIVAWKSFFGHTKMNEVASRIRDMKYGSTSAATKNVVRNFAAREGHKRACVLTDSSIRIASYDGRKVLILDLDAVAACDVGPTHGLCCCKHGSLALHLKKGMNIDGQTDTMGVQPLEVRLLPGEDALEIAQEIMQRAHVRQNKQ